MAKHILCTIPSLVAAVRSSEKHSVPVNGIDFEEHPDGAISVEPVEDDTVVWRFSRIPGYELRDSKGDSETVPAKGKAKAKAEDPKKANKDPAPPLESTEGETDPTVGGEQAPPLPAAGTVEQEQTDGPLVADDRPATEAEQASDPAATPEETEAADAPETTDGAEATDADPEAPAAS